MNNNTFGISAVIASCQRSIELLEHLDFADYIEDEQKRKEFMQVYCQLSRAMSQHSLAIAETTDEIARFSVRCAEETEQISRILIEKNNEV